MGEWMNEWVDGGEWVDGRVDGWMCGGGQRIVGGCWLDDGLMEWWMNCGWMER